MSSDNLLDQSEIENLLNQKQVPVPPVGGGMPAGSADAAEGSAGASPTAASPAGEATASAASASGTMADTLKQPPGQEGDASDQAEGGISQNDIDSLLKQAQDAIASVDAPEQDGLPQGAASFQLPEFSSQSGSMEATSLELLNEVELDLKIELGRTHMYLEDVLKLRQGSVVPLDKLAGDPVDIYVNGRLIARGEVLVLNDNFCVRVAELIAGVEGGE